MNRNHFRLFLLTIASAIIPSMAYSQEQWKEVATAEEFSAAIDNHETAIRLTSDFVSDRTQPYLIETPTVIDLNGFHATLSASISNRGYISLTIQDSSEEQTGAVTSSTTVITNNVPGEVHIKGGTFETSGKRDVISVTKYGNFFLEGGRINATDYGYAVNNEGHFYFTGGAIVGKDGGGSPVRSKGIGVTEMTGGAIYAGNRSIASCFETTYWDGGDGDIEEAKTILPEGIYDGGAIVLDEKWAIPGTKYINYNLPDYAEMGHATHYYYPGNEFKLPECNYYNYIPFAGWSRSDGDDANLLTSVGADIAENLELYPVWKYQGIGENVSVDLIPLSVSPEPNTTVEKIGTINLAYGVEIGGVYVNEEAETFGYIKNLTTGEKVSNLTISTDWDGNVELVANPEVTANGSYEVFVPAATFGDDTWYYDDMQDGRCNPDLRYNYKIRNAPQGTTKVNADPPTNSETGSLKNIKLTFVEYKDVLNSYIDDKITVTNEQHVIIAELSSMDVAYDENESNSVIITLPEEIKEPGVYTMDIPKGFFNFDWGMTDCSALSLKWTVTGTSGLNSVTKGMSDEPEVYDLTGRRIDVGNVNSLRRGIYIINGKKKVIH